MDNYLIPVIPFHKEIVERGEGSYVYDTDGNKLLDVNSGQFCTVLGHSNPELALCIKKITENIAHTNTSMLSSEVLKAAENLNRISGDMNAFSILLSTGSEAVEFCIRYAKHIKKKNGILCFEKGYHGLTLGSQSVTFSGKYALPAVSDIYSVPVPDTFATQEELTGDIEKLEGILKQSGSDIAAVLMEPIVSVGGMIFPDKYYFEEVRRLCTEYDVLLIFDESQTGYGRTGEWFAYRQMGIVPDMVACAKGIGLGYPVAAALFADYLIPKDGFAMSHYSSHQNDAFSAAIINFGIDYIERNNILNEVKEKGKYFLDKLMKISESNSVISRPRGRGLMIGFELKIEGVENYRTVYPKLCDMAAKEGLIIQATNGGQTIRFLPSYTISYQEIDFCIDVIDKITKKILSVK